MKKNIVLILMILLLIASVVTASKFLGSKTPATQQTQVTQATKYWTCGMHPSVRVTDEEYRRGKINCPICNMPLIPAEEKKPETSKIIEPKDLKEVISEEIFSRVNISRREADLAGVMTEPVKKYQLTKTMRTVGKVAFDPELSVAQEEFLTAIETRQKVAESSDMDVIKRADDLMEKSKFKLRLLGMSNDEISELEKEGKAQLNLVLPEDKAWVYAEVYEYELGWIKTGQEAVITTTAYPGEEFKGIVKHISPVLNPMTRSATVRIEVDNISHKLKPEMYADVIIKSVYVGQDGEKEVLAIPKDAVLDTGIRKIVYVEAERGIYLGKEVQIGPAASASINGMERQLYPMIKGLNEGDNVVTKANFLLDSQSQLSPAVAGAYGGALETKEETKPPVHQH